MTIHAQLLTLSGNPRPASRTAALVERIGDNLAAALDLTVAHVDLADVPAPLGSGAADAVRPYLDALGAASLAVIATPTYKGSYTGLLKAFLDLLPANALSGVVAVPVQTLGAPRHSLAADVHLRPLLIELGARTPTRAVVVTEADLNDIDTTATNWARLLLPELSDVIGPTTARTHSLARA